MDPTTNGQIKQEMWLEYDFPRRGKAWRHHFMRHARTHSSQRILSLGHGESLVELGNNVALLHAQKGQISMIESEYRVPNETIHIRTHDLYEVESNRFVWNRVWDREQTVSWIRKQGDSLVWEKTMRCGTLGKDTLVFANGSVYTGVILCVVPGGFLTQDQGALFYDLLARPDQVDLRPHQKDYVEYTGLQTVLIELMLSYLPLPWQSVLTTGNVKKAITQKSSMFS
jgi:hypothetical protein